MLIISCSWFLWFYWWKIVMFIFLSYIYTRWSWLIWWVVSSPISSWGHARSLVTSNHVKLIPVHVSILCLVVLPLLVLCERRLHEHSPSLGLWEGIDESVCRWWVVGVLETQTLVLELFLMGLLWIQLFNDMVRFIFITPSVLERVYFQLFGGSDYLIVWPSLCKINQCLWNQIGIWWKYTLSWI